MLLNMSYQLNGNEILKSRSLCFLTDDFLKKNRKVYKIKWRYSAKNKVRLSNIFPSPTFLSGKD